MGSPDPPISVRERPRTRSAGALHPPSVSPFRSRSPVAGPSGVVPASAVRREEPWVRFQEELQTRVVRVSVERMSSDTVRRLLRGSEPVPDVPELDSDGPETSQAEVPSELDPERVAQLIAAMDRRVAQVQAENRAVAEAMLRTLRRRRR